MSKSTLDPVALLRFYSNVSELVVARQYQDAQSLLNEIKYANVPDELQDTIDFYSSLSGQLLTTLNNLEFLLDETSTLFSAGQIDEARQKLTDSETTVRDSIFLLEDIETALGGLGNTLGVFADFAGSQIRQAYESQQQNIYQLRQLVGELDQLRQSLGLNPLMIINTSFYHPTLIEVAAPESAYPGLSITINGKVSSTHDNVDRIVRIVRVFLDNTQLAEETIQGQFSFQITLPEQISSGKHILTLQVIAHESYAHASRSLPINIVIPTWTEIHTPLFITIPKIIHISGKVHYSPSPLKDTWIKFTFGDSSTIVRTATDGNFFTTMEVPFSLSLVGPQKLGIIIEPVEPRYTTLEITRWILIVNPLYASLLLIAIPLGMLVFNKTRARPLRLQGEIITETRLPEPPILAPALRYKYEVTGIKSRILSAYLTGIEVVQKVTGISMVPNVTFREFLKAATPRLPGAINSFTELTTICEIAVYSTHKIDRNTAARAELLTVIIKEELHSEAT
ncbi:DUF4129 domain-containing protein [Chloroflexota bacterium]